MTQPINNSDALLGYLINQSNSGQKNWFGYPQQRVAGINLAHQIAANHANTMTPNEVVDYVVLLNNTIYNKIIKG
jgi:hypothetical protein